MVVDLVESGHVGHPTVAPEEHRHHSGMPEDEHLEALARCADWVQ